MHNKKKFRPTLHERLEDRTVPSHLLGRFAPSQVFNLSGGGGRRGGIGLEFQGGNLGGTHQGSSKSGSPTSLLTQDARSVQRAYQTFNASFLSAVAALRKTATTTSPPTSAGLADYNTSIESAISKLNASVTSALSNLPSSGPSLTSTILGYTSTLQDELESAGSGLANSTNASVLALKKEASSYIRGASSQSVGAILDNQPTGGVTSTEIQTYNQAARSAYQTFNLALNNTIQTAISSGSQLDSSAVTSAINALQSSLDSGITGLGSTFAGSTYNPTGTVNARLTTLQSQLLAITAPSSSNSHSTRLFTKSVASVVNQNTRIINQVINTAIQNYNNSLL